MSYSGIQQYHIKLCNIHRRQPAEECTNTTSAKFTHATHCGRGLLYNEEEIVVNFARQRPVTIKTCS